MAENQYRLSFSARLRVWAAPHLLQARDFVRECLQDIPLLTRIASHVGLLLLMLVTIAASGVQFSLNLDRGGPISNDAADAEPFNPFDPAIEEEAALARAPMPITIAPKRTRRDVVKYSVQPGDNVSVIAERFEITGDSILWANPKLEDNPDSLSIGQVLNIPPVSGVLVTVQNNDTLKALAEKYKSTKTKPEQLIQNIVALDFNQERHDLQEPDLTLTAGQYLMIPGGYKPYVPRVVTVYSGPIPNTAARGTGSFGWPVSGRITQGFKTFHRALDIGAPTGKPVVAADSGYVVQAGWSNVGYGFMILINHGNGYLTRYAHLSALNVEVGDSVKKGQMIGRVGSTGNSTGPHLHFEIIRNGVHRNPFGLLPGG
jgi:murein DD-endopeptidase MepM/ murein hydrolase activator NlpD